MPIMDGFEATSKLREMMRRQAIQDCPIIAITAGADCEDPKERNAYIAGGFDHAGI